MGESYERAGNTSAPTHNGGSSHATPAPQYEDPVSYFRLTRAVSGFVAGGLLGGLVHTLLMDRAIEEALNRSGIKPNLYGVKPLGESIAASIVLYGSALLTVCFFLGIYGVVQLNRTLSRWRNGLRLSIGLSIPALCGALLGASCAAVANLWGMNRLYAEELADGERHAVASASALPELQRITVIFCVLLLAIFAAMIVRRRYAERHQAM